MMTCDYRIVKTVDKDTGEEFYGVYEVFYNDNHEPVTRTEQPVGPSGETMDELREDLSWI